MTRAEAAAFSDLGLVLAYERLAGRIEADWRRGAPGMLSHVFALAMLRFEAEVRSLSLSPIRLRDQETLPGFPAVDVNGDLIHASLTAA
jgi:hypothetical protein